MVCVEITEIQKGPGRWNLLLTSLYEGKELEFGFRRRPKEKSVHRSANIMMRSVKRQYKEAGLCEDWILEGVVSRDMAVYDIPKGTVFFGEYNTNVRTGICRLVFPESYDPDQNMVRTPKEGVWILRPIQKAANGHNIGQFGKEYPDAYDRCFLCGKRHAEHHGMECIED